MSDSRFHLRAKVATTGLSQVWRAFDFRLEVEIALKRPAALTDGDQGHRQGLEALEREYRALCYMHHPHIVPLLDGGSDNEGRFLCLQWVHGELLESRIERRPLNEDQALALMRSLLSALTAIHKAGYSHGDLKADNVIVDSFGHATLIDFGNAMPLGAQAPDQVGSLHAMAPELFASAPRSVATDLYALGVLAYHSLSGQLPFQGDTRPQVIAAHHRHWRKPLSELCAVSPALNEWIETMMSVVPAQRPATVLDAWRALERGGAGGAMEGIAKRV